MFIIINHISLNSTRSIKVFYSLKRLSEYYYKNKESDEKLNISLI